MTHYKGKYVVFGGFNKQTNKNLNDLVVINKNFSERHVLHKIEARVMHVVAVVAD